MPLAEDKRKQLDALVLRMTSAKAPDDEIRAVVEDFKSKYDAPSQSVAPHAAPGPARTWGDTLTDVGAGALKGAGHTAVGLGRLVHMIPGVSAGVDKLYGAFGVQGVDSGADFKRSTESRLGLDPTNSAQKVGMFGEQLGELALPAAKVGQLTKGTGLLTRMAAEGGVNAITSAIQGSDDPLLAGVLGAAGPVAGKLLNAGAQGITKKAFKPAAKLFAEYPTLAQDILDAGAMPTRKSARVMKAATDRARQVADGLVAKADAAPTVRFKQGNGPWLKSNRVNLREEIINPTFNPVAAVKDPNTLNALGKATQGYDKLPFYKTADEMAARIVRNNPAEQTLTETLAAKRMHGRASGKVFQTDAPEVAFSKQLNADLESAAEVALSKRLGPAWAKMNRETQRKLIVQKATQLAARAAQAGSSPVGRLRSDLLVGGIGTAIGGPATGLGAVAAKEIASHALGSPVVKQYVARGLNAAGKAAPTVGRVAAEGSTQRNRRKPEVDNLYEKYRQR